MFWDVDSGGPKEPYIRVQIPMGRGNFEGRKGWLAVKYRYRLL